MRIAVMGTGGVGGYFGARLAAAGEDVTFVARGAHLAALRESGLRLRSGHGDLALAPVRATAYPAEIGGPVDAVLFSVKMYDTESAAAAVRPIVGPETAVISLQNGVDNEAKLAAVFGPERVVGGVTYIFSAIGAPGEIVHTSPIARIVLGELDGRASPRLAAIRDACQQAGIDAEISNDIQAILWSKFISNCAGNGLSSVVRSPLGVIQSTPELKRLYRECAEEVAAVGRARGVGIAENAVDTLMAGFDRVPPEVRTSTEQDLANGRRLELDGLNGLVVRYGAQVGVATPINRFITAVLRPFANGRPG